jgi:DNA polymerase elongation subunit (family B)
LAKQDLHDLISLLKKCSKELGGKTPTLREFMSFGASRRQIDKHGGHNEIVKLAGLEPNFDPFAKHEVDPRPPKILLFDIETSAIKAHVWGGYEQNVGRNQVREDWYLLSWAAKWHGEDEVFYEDVRSSGKSSKDKDRKILKGIHKLLMEADIVVGHNSDKFDIKKLNARFIKYGMKPISHYKKVDTLKIARKHFNFTFNTLAYLAEYLEVGESKSEHKKFPGMELWNACMDGDRLTRREAFEEMELYNKKDVTVLEKVYNKLAPFEPSLKFSTYHQTTVCSCGSYTFIKDGITYTASGNYQRYVCKGCGKVFRDRKNLITKDQRKDMLC